MHADEAVECRTVFATARCICVHLRLNLLAYLVWFRGPSSTATGTCPQLYCRQYHEPSVWMYPRRWAKMQGEESDADRRCANSPLGNRPAQQPLALAGDALHPGGGHRPDGRRRCRCRRHSSAGLGPGFDRHGLQGGAGLPGPVRDHGFAAARPAGIPRAHRALARTAGHARPALHVPARSRAAMAARRHDRLAVGGGRKSRSSHRHAGDGFADGPWPDRRNATPDFA